MKNEIYVNFFWFLLKGKQPTTTTSAARKPTAEDLAILKLKVERDRQKAVEKFKKEQAEKKKQEEIEQKLTDAEIAQIEAEYSVASEMPSASSVAPAAQPKNEAVITSADIRSWKKSQEREKISSNPNPGILDLRPEHFAILRMKNERDRLKDAEKEKEQNHKKDN